MRSTPVTISQLEERRRFLYTLKSLVDQLRPKLIDVLHLPSAAERIEVQGFHLPGTDAADRNTAASQLLLAVRSTSPEEVAESLDTISGYAAMIVSSAAIDESSATLAKAHGVALLALQPGVSWMRLMGTLFNLLDQGSIEELIESVIPGPESDLFEVADWVAAQLGAPVTIEDPMSRVVAFSAHVGLVDAARVESIMRRAVPHHYLDRMRKRGVFRRLAAATSPLFIAGRQPDIQPRVAMPVRAGNEVLGSIWVVSDEPLEARHSRVLMHSASVVALHLLRRRQLLSFERRVHTDSVRDLLTGHGREEGGGGGELAWLAEGGELLVLATGLAVDAGEHSHAEWERQEVTDAIRAHLLALVPSSVTGLLGRTVYTVLRLQEPRATAFATLQQALTSFVTGFTRNGQHRPLQIGIGSSVDNPRRLPESREMADLVLETIAESGWPNVVATVEAVGAQALLLQSRKTIRRFPMLGGTAVGRLRDYDAEHGTLLTETLYAWLCAHGHVELAAEQLHVHANTVRYRMRQLRELGVIDLEDPAERFAAYLHLQAQTQL